MNDPQLAAELRSSSPDALPELLDVYGDQLFSFCWTLLRNRENAQIAVRDALIAAAAHAGRLTRDEWLGSWLYCLARAECRLRAAVPARDADEPAVQPKRGDADSRLLAWNAVTSLAADELEALELDCRHQVDLGLVLGLPPADVEALLDQARRSLQQALTAEIVVARSHGCPDRAVVLGGWTGVTTPVIRDRVLEHAATCPVCAPHRPQSVSAARVFAQLPTPELASLARLEILGFVSDPRMSAYCEFAASRAAEVTGSAFLTPPAFLTPLAFLTPPTIPSPDPGTPATGPQPMPATAAATAPQPVTGPAATGPQPTPAAAPTGPQLMPGAAVTGPQPARSDAGLGPDLGRTSPEPALGPVRTSPEPGLPGRPPMPRPAVAHGFIGSWEPAGSAAARPPAGAPAPSATPPVASAPVTSAPVALAAARSRPATVPAHAPAPRPPADPSPTHARAAAGLAVAVAGLAATERTGAPTGPTASIAPAGLATAPARIAAVPAPPAVPAVPAVPAASRAPVAKIPAPSAAALVGTTPGLQPPATRQPAPATGRAKPHAARRFRGSRLRTATVAATILTAAIAFVGLRGMHSPRPGAPAAATATQSGSATIQAGGGTNVAAPVEVAAPGSGQATSPSTHGTAAKAESLAVTATQPDATDTRRSASSQSRPSHRPDTKVSAVNSPSASPSHSGPAEAIGTLTVIPGQLDLGTGTEGHLTLTAANGPVSWSASTTSGRLTLSSSQGTLQAGQSVTLTVTVNRNAGHGGNASVVVDWNPVTPAAPAVPAAAPTSSQAVQVSWAADPQPDPSPSASGSASSSAPPSPAASSVMGQ